MEYQFRILGPVEISHNGRSADLGSPKRLAMLVALLLEANHPVSLSRLAAAMWSATPPKSAVANIRSHAGGLRQVLGCRLVARPRAYELRVTDGEVDADEFARLTRAGRESLAAADPAAAIVRLGTALALWRGVAGDGLPRGAALDARLLALDEQRLDAFDDYIEARLHTGDFTQIAADLRRHLAAWPVRERSWGQLIRALYWSGNAPAALAAYTEARTSLRDQLGIELGAELQELQRAVLNRDAALEPPRSTSAGLPTTPAVGGPPLLQLPELPPDVDHLVEREDELTTLVTALRAGDQAVLLHGRAGVGKSALALRAAHQVRAAFPDGAVRVCLDCAGAHPAPVVESVLLALGLPAAELPATAAALEALYRSTVRQRRVLLLLDGLSSAAQLRPLLGGGPTLLITGRRPPPALDNVRCLPVRPLTEPAAGTLVCEYAGADRAAGDPGAIRQLVQLCDGLPLALRIVGERLARRPDLPAALLSDHLASRPLDGLRLGELSVRAALAAEFHTLAAEDPVAAQVFPRLGRLAPTATTTPDSLADELGEDASLVFYALEQLVDGWLAESPRPGRYRTTGLHRAYAAELPVGQVV